MLKYHLIKKDFLPGLRCDFQLTIEKGNPLVIYGDNGIGKSTLLHLIFNEDQINHTKVLLPQKISPPFFDRTLKVLKEIILKMPGIDVVRFNKFWTEFNFDKKEELSLSYLSGGERQMLQIIFLLSREAELYLLDEPSVALDENNKKRFLKLITEFFANKFLIIVEHEMTWIPSSWSKSKVILDAKTIRFLP